MKLKHLLIAPLAAFLLAGCNEVPSADGYTFGQPEYFKPTNTVETVVHETPLKLRQAAQKLGVSVEPDRKLMAFAQIYPDRCVMHVVEPTYLYQPEFIGHEFSHCVWGSWHQ